jgi:hypothetical protein
MGELPGQVCSLLFVHAGRQAILTRLGQFPYESFDPSARFPFAKNDFREAAPFTPVQIEVGVTQVGQRRAAQLLERGLNAQVSVTELFEDIT